MHCQQVQLLQQQVTTLADTQSTSDDRYARAKADNAVLQARVHMLEEHVREVSPPSYTSADGRCRFINLLKAHSTSEN